MTLNVENFISPTYAQNEKHVFILIKRESQIISIVVYVEGLCDFFCKRKNSYNIERFCIIFFTYEVKNV